METHRQFSEHERKLYEGTSKTSVMISFPCGRGDMLHWFCVYICMYVIPLYVHMWNFEGIDQRSKLLFPFKVALVIYTGLILEDEKEERVEIGALIFIKKKLCCVVKFALPQRIWYTLLNIIQGLKVAYFRYQRHPPQKKTYTMHYKIQVADMNIKVEERG